MVILEQGFVIPKRLLEEGVSQMRKMHPLDYVEQVRKWIICAEKFSKHLVGVGERMRRAAEERILECVLEWVRVCIER